MVNELEKRMKSEFDSIDVDPESIMQSLKQNPSKPEHAAVKRYSRSIRYTFKVAAIIVVLLTLTVTALAVTHYLGGFDRLRGIIGDERADMLQPMEVGNVVGEIITDEGFRVELIAVGVFDNVVDVYISLEDLESNRLDGDSIFDFVLFANVSTVQPQMSFSELPQIIGRTEDGVVTFHIRTIFSRSVTGQELQFNLSEIWYNHRTYERKMEFDLGTVTEQVPADWVFDRPVLQSYMHHVESEPPVGFEYVIQFNLSSVGIIDGKLHVQEVLAPARYLHHKGWSVIRLSAPHGEMIGGPDLEHLFEHLDFIMFSNYRETVYQVDLNNLSEYRLVEQFGAWDSLIFNWSVAFEVETEEMVLVADNLDIYLENYSAVLAEVRVAPFSVRLSIRADHTEWGNIRGNFPSAVINTTDGAVEVGETWISSMWHEIVPGMSAGSPAVARAMIDGGGLPVGLHLIGDFGADVLDLSTVISIEIAGEVIEF